MSNSRRVRLFGALAAVGVCCGLLAAMPAGSGQSVHVPSLIPSAIAKSDQLTAFDQGSESVPACSQARLASAKQIVGQYLSDRVSQLGVLSTRISNSKSIPVSDASTLEGIVSNEKTGIADGGIVGLQSMVSSATTCLQVVSDAEAMVRDFRVYALASPQVDLTAVASAESAIGSQAATYESKVQSAITTAGQHGKDVSGAQSAYTNLVAEISDSETEVGDVSISTLLAQVPSDYPADASTLVGYHEDVAAAAADLRSAYEDFRTIVTELTS
jgi:hypothetical protein